MKSVITFIIPVRHPENARDWQSVKTKLAETVHSISMQTSGAWNAVIVANRGSDLPDLPSRFDVKWVDFPPNPLSERDRSDREKLYDAFRIDKGRRILAGMLHADKTGYIMLMDDDDFVSNRITEFVVQNFGGNGWYIKNGYVWAERGNLLYLHDNFSKFCGSSHIIRSDLYRLPPMFESPSDDYIRRMLGSHMFIHEHLDSIGANLAPLPFVGAIYRVGQSNSVSKTRGIIREFLVKKKLLKRPWEFCQRILRLRLLSASVREEFMGYVNRPRGREPGT